MVQAYFDAGIFLILLVIGFLCLFLYQKIGALLLLVSILAFLISGLLILTGYDVSSYTTTITSSEPNGINQTSYLIGNGATPLQFTGQLVLGWIFIVISLVIGIVFLDQTIKGRLILGD